MEFEMRNKLYSDYSILFKIKQDVNNHLQLFIKGLKETDQDLEKLRNNAACALSILLDYTVICKFIDNVGNKVIYKRSLTFLSGNIIDETEKKFFDINIISSIDKRMAMYKDVSELKKQIELNLDKEYKDKKLKLYHFIIDENNKLDNKSTGRYIDYEIILITDELIEHLYMKLDSIVHTHDTTVIFIDNCNNTNFIRTFNEYIKSKNTPRKNIKIINFLTDFQFRIINNIYFYKIINVW